MGESRGLRRASARAPLRSAAHTTRGELDRLRVLSWLGVLAPSRGIWTTADGLVWGVARVDGRAC